MGFEPTNLYRMRCPSQISSNSFATKTTSEHRDDAWIHSRHQSHAVDQAWQPRSNFLLYLTTYNAFYEAEPKAT